MMCRSFVKDDVVNPERAQFAGFPFKADCPVINRLSHHRVVVLAVRDHLATGLEENLIDAVLRFRSSRLFLLSSRNGNESLPYSWYRFWGDNMPSKYVRQCS